MATFTGVTAPLYNDLIDRGQNILIAGMTGSGKSVMLNGMINSIFYKSTTDHKMALCDVKVVEFSRYANTKHCIGFAKTPKEVEELLEGIMRLISARFDDAEKKGIRIYDGSTLHLFVDEMADLVLTSKKATDLLQRICQLGRAAKVQVICATQCPLASVIPTRIKVNFPIVVGLHTQTAQHSRNILEVEGCEDLPMFGEALIKYPTTGIERQTVTMIPDEWLEKVVEQDRK